MPISFFYNSKSLPNDRLLDIVREEKKELRKLEGGEVFVEKVYSDRGVFKLVFSSLWTNSNRVDS